MEKIVGDGIDRFSQAERLENRRDRNVRKASTKSHMSYRILTDKKTCAHELEKVKSLDFSRSSRGEPKNNVDKLFSK